MNTIQEKTVLCRISLTSQCLILTFSFVVFLSVLSPTNLFAEKLGSSDQNIHGNFVWHDLLTDDLQSASLFYEKLFGWSFLKSSSGNRNVKKIYSGENHIGNAIEIAPLKKDERESQWLSYISVVNVDDTVTRIKNNNGKIYIQPRVVPQRGRVAVCLDSQKAVFAILQNQEGSNPVYPIKLNNWLGSELWTNDLNKAQIFYGGIVGYDMQTIKMNNGETYQMFMNAGQPRAGIVKIPFEDVQPNWVPYIAVKDTIAVSEKILQLGGQLLTEPDRDLPENAAVIVADPTGVVFGIQQVASMDVAVGGVQ